jgi:hypothetical protein
MDTSRSVPQQMEQIVSPRAGQNRFALRFWQMGQITIAIMPHFPRTPPARHLRGIPSC